MVHVRRDFPTRFLKLGKKSILKLVSHIAVPNLILTRGSDPEMLLNTINNKHRQ
jgi:hypothetical protein